MGAKCAWRANDSRVIGKRSEKGIVLPTVLPTVGRSAPRPRFFVGSLRHSAGITVGSTKPFPRRSAIKIVSCSHKERLILVNRRAGGADLQQDFDEGDKDRVHCPTRKPLDS